MQQSSDAATAKAEAVQPLESAQPTDDLDLLSIGLAVFFLSLIVVVGALLILPAIF
jgi:hypothetical protein